MRQSTSQTTSKSSQSKTTQSTRGSSLRASSSADASTQSSGASVTGVYNDKQILQDTLMSQKHITDAYNTFAGECVSEKLRGTMLSILNDEHTIQATIFSSMQSNGWYKTEPATAKSIQKVKQKATAN